MTEPALPKCTFRFGFQIRETSAAELRRLARAVEDAGFDVIHTWDH